MKTQTLLQILNISAKEYEEKVLQNWVNWCTSRINRHQNLQKIITCQPLYNWWLKELQKLELQFTEDMQNISQLDADACMQAYDFSTNKIYNRFSKPLIKKAQL